MAAPSEAPRAVAAATAGFRAIGDQNLPRLSPGRYYREDGAKQAAENAPARRRCPMTEPAARGTEGQAGTPGETASGALTVIPPARLLPPAPIGADAKSVRAWFDDAV
jgi:hypothetical protein